MNENKIKEGMTNKTNEALVEIVTKLRNEYQPEAIIAAEEELKTRNIDFSEITLDDHRSSTETNFSIDYMEIIIRIFALIFPWIFNAIGRSLLSLFMPQVLTILITFPLTIFLQILIYRKLVKMDYVKKAIIFKTWTYIGYVGSVILGLISYFLIKFVL
ncbi:MAG: hypothetical protein IPO21_14840 [Bacteroidales bacterium]|nr:hypothetical protein [Bacteroidales bacterium]